MPRQVHCFLVVVLLAMSLGASRSALAQIRSVAPVGSAGSIRIGPSFGPTMSGGVPTLPLGGVALPQGSGLTAVPLPRIGTVPSVGGAETRPTKESSPRRDEKAPLGRSPESTRAKSGSGGAGGAGEGSGDGPDESGRGALSWVKHVPGWVWIVALLLSIVLYRSSRK